MARYYYLCVTLISATDLENKRGRKAQSPMVAFLVTPSCNRVLSRPAINGGENPKWYRKYILLCEECDCKDARLTMILFHEGTKHDTILGVAGNIRVSNLELGDQQLEVRDESGRVGRGLLNIFVRVVHPPTPTQRSFTVTVYRALGLKNVKWFWKRISLTSLCVRKMKPYVVVKSNLDPDKPLCVSPIAGKDGRNPVFNFSHTFTCNESLIQQNILGLKIELYHCHKAEYYGSYDGVRAKDIKIGIVEGIKVSQMEKRQNEYHPVCTPKEKERGTIEVSVALWELKQQEQEEQELLTPSPTNPSWDLRIRPRHGYPGVRNLAELLIQCFGPASGMILVGLGIAAVV